MKLRSLMVAAPLALALAPAAHAAGWKQVTASDGANTDQVSLLRTGDGTLHVAWRRGAPNADALMHTTISRGGRIGATSTVVAGQPGHEHRVLGRWRNDLGAPAG